MSKAQAIRGKITTSLLLRVLARMLLAGDLLIMVVLRIVFPLPSLNEHRIAERWLQHAYALTNKDVQQFIPSLAKSIQSCYYFVSAYQILDCILILLIVMGTKLGPRLLMYRTILLLILQCLVFVPTFESLFLQPGEQSMEYFRELGVIGACLVLI